MKAAAAALLVALGLAAAASAATPTATKYVDKKDGYSIIVPAKWYPVPRTVAAVKATIADLKKRKQANLATAYGFYLTANGKQELAAYRFQAFYFNGPSMDPVPIDVSLQVNDSIAYAPKNLQAAGIAYGKQFASIQGAKISAPKMVKLPEGQAVHLTGSVPNGGGVSTGLDLYLLIHAKKLYALSFKVNAAGLTQ